MLRNVLIASITAIAGVAVGSASGWLAHDRWATRGVDSAWFQAQMFDAATCGVVLQAFDSGRTGMARKILEQRLASAAEGMDRLMSQGALEGSEPGLIPDTIKALEEAREYIRAHPVDNGTAEKLDRELLAIR